MVAAQKSGPAGNHRADGWNQSRSLPLDEDVNLWKVVRAEDQVVVTWIALYVDDMMLVGPEVWAKAVAESLQERWATTPVEWSGSKWSAKDPR